jgi:hypothetical protein
VAERVGDRPEAIAPELIGDLHRERRTRVDRLLHDGVDVLDVHEDARARAAQLLGRPGRRLRRRVGEHDHRVSDAELGVADPVVRRIHAHALLGAERTLVVLDRLRRVVDGEIRREGVVPVRNRLRRHRASNRS